MDMDYIWLTTGFRCESIKNKDITWEMDCVDRPSEEDEMQNAAGRERGDTDKGGR
jgi:hypothetical protein